MSEADRILLAAKDGDVSTLRAHRQLLSLATDSFGASMLHYAARTGQLACLKWLYQAIGESEAKLMRTKTGASPLHDSAAQGHLECVRFFVLQCGIAGDVRDISGHTPLHLAARFGRSDVVKWLLDEGCSEPRARSRNNMTPVHFAAAGGSEVCLRLLLAKAGYSAVNDAAADGTLPTFLAAQDGNLKCLKYLHSVGGRCNMKTRDGILPIHGAAQNGHLHCLIFLVDSGQASLADRDSMGATPAHYAASQGHVKILLWMGSKGSVSHVDNLGGTPLHDAAEQGEFECIKYLVETAGLEVLKPDNSNATPIDLADRHSHRRCRDFLKIAVSKARQSRKRAEKSNNPQRLMDAGRPESNGLKSPEEPFRGNLSRVSSPNKDDPPTKPRVSFQERTLAPSGRSQPMPGFANEKQAVKIGRPRRDHSGKVVNLEVGVGEGAEVNHEACVLIARPATQYTEQRTRKGRQLTVAEERDRNVSASYLGQSCGDLRVPCTGSWTTTASSRNPRQQKAAGELGSSLQAYAEQPIPRPGSGFDAMMSRLQSGQSVRLQHSIPPPAQFSGERDKTAETFGVDPVVWQAMPQWKRQVLISRRQRDEETKRQKQREEEEEQKKWEGVPLWRIALNQRKEHERLMEEQKWAGVPSWKKTLLLHKQNSPART